MRSVRWTAVRLVNKRLLNSSWTLSWIRSSISRLHRLGRIQTAFSWLRRMRRWRWSRRDRITTLSMTGLHRIGWTSSRRIRGNWCRRIWRSSSRRIRGRRSRRVACLRRLRVWRWWLRRIAKLGWIPTGLCLRGISTLLRWVATWLRWVTTLLWRITTLLRWITARLWWISTSLRRITRIETKLTRTRCVWSCWRWWIQRIWGRLRHLTNNKRLDKWKKQQMKRRSYF